MSGQAARRTTPAGKTTRRPTAAPAPGPGDWSDVEDLRWAARHWATRIGVKPSQIHLRPMTTKWGSVSRKGRLTLDTGLLGLPRDLAEYVVVHELVHFLAPNHGKLFQSFLFAYLPDWEGRHQRLQQHQRKGVTDGTK
jgi:predicted metal-dependent hydrolase